MKTKTKKEILKNTIPLKVRAKGITNKKQWAAYIDTVRLQRQSARIIVHTNCLDRYRQAQSDLAYRLRHLAPTSSKNAGYYTDVEGSSVTVTTYSKRSRWRPSVARNTYLYWQDRRLSYETGRGRKGETSFLLPASVWFTRYESEASLPHLPAFRLPEHPYICRVYNGMGDAVGYARRYELPDGSLYWQHGRTLPICETEHQRRYAIETERRRQNAEHERQQKRIERALRLYANWPIVSYDRMRAVGACEYGILSFAESIGLDTTDKTQTVALRSIPEYWQRRLVADYIGTV